MPVRTSFHLPHEAAIFNSDLLALARIDIDMSAIKLSNHLLLFGVPFYFHNFGLRIRLCWDGQMAAGGLFQAQSHQPCLAIVVNESSLRQSQKIFYLSHHILRVWNGKFQLPFAAENRAFRQHTIGSGATWRSGSILEDSALAPDRAEIGNMLIRCRDKNPWQRNCGSGRRRGCAWIHVRCSVMFSAAAYASCG